MGNINDKNVRIDKRSIKTKKAIKTAFMSLVTKSDISKITIKEISDIAIINRKTFYAHYVDVYAVIDDIENDMVSRILKVINDNDIAQMISNPYQIFYLLFQLITEDVELNSLFVNYTVLSTMLDKIKKVIAESLISLLVDKTTVDAKMLSYIIDFVAAGFIASFREWFNSDRSVSLEELSRQLSIIVAKGVVSIMK